MEAWKRWLEREDVKQYRSKLSGLESSALSPRPPSRVILLSAAGAFSGALAIYLVNFIFLRALGLGNLVIAFGASILMLFGAPDNPLAQPWNVIGGHCVSALSGSLVGLLFLCCSKDLKWLACSCALGLATASMLYARCLHPPAGPTAIVPIMAQFSVLGAFILLVLVCGASLWLIFVATAVNNLIPGRQYPLHWRFPFTLRPKFAFRETDWAAPNSDVQATAAEQSEAQT